MYKKEIDEIRDLIGNNRIDNAIEQFQKLPLEDLAIELNTIKTKNTKLKREVRMGIVRSEEEGVRHGQITFGILDLLNTFEKSKKKEPSQIESLVTQLFEIPDNHLEVHESLSFLLQQIRPKGINNAEQNELLEELGKLIEKDNKEAIAIFNKLLEKKVLYIGSECEHLDPIGIEKEYKIIETSITSSFITIDKILNPTFGDLIEKWDTFKPDVLFFSCHGDELGLFLKDSEGKCKHYNNTDFLNFFKKRSYYTSCTILSACESSSLGEAATQWCKNVISIDAKVDINTTLEFNKYFFKYINKSPKFEDDVYKNAFDRSLETIQIEGLTDSFAFEFFTNNNIK